MHGDIVSKRAAPNIFQTNGKSGNRLIWGLNRQRIFFCPNEFGIGRVSFRKNNVFHPKSNFDVYYMMGAVSSQSSPAPAFPERNPYGKQSTEYSPEQRL